MSNTVVYYLDGQVVDKHIWMHELDVCIEAAQTRTHDRGTKQSIRIAVLTDIESGRGSFINGHEFQKHVKVML